MQVVQTVVGVFHHFELAHQLSRRGHLRKLYSTWPWARLKREGLARGLVETFPFVHPATYLLTRADVLNPRATAALDWLNVLSFDRWTSHRVPPCDALIGISSTSLRTGRLVQQRGGKFICDRGSTHHRYQQTVLREEYLRWGIAPPLWDERMTLREEESYRLADAITVPSEVARRSFLAEGVPAEKLHVLPYGVRLDRFCQQAHPPTDTLHLLFAGHISLRKGIPYLLQAFARLRHPHKQLTLVGSVDQALLPLLATLPQTNVTFTGAIPQHELATLMSRSHLLVLPSIEEGLALVQAQAMSCGCPVLATAETGAEDLFTDGVEGFIVPARDVDALVDRMQLLADDPQRQARMSEAALRRVTALGGWDHYGDLWETLLRDLTNRQARIA